MNTTALGLYFWALSGLLILMMVWEHHHKAHDLLSLRNLFLVGFIVFQLSSAAVSLYLDDFGNYRVRYPRQAGLQFAVMCTVFVLVFLWAYRRGWIVRWLAGKLPQTTAAPTGFFLLTMGMILTLVGIVLRMALQVSLLAILANYAAIGFAAIACGLVGWVWGRRLLNPAMILVGLVILVVNLANAAWGEFGRRPLIAVFGALIWGMYYSYWRYLPLRSLLHRLTLVSLGPLLIVALFTSVRASSEKDRTASEHLQAVVHSGQVGEGMWQLLSGQGTAAAAMWVIENYPERFEYRHLMTLWYSVAIDVPRAWWPDKPLPLSKLIPEQAKIPNVNWRSLTLPAGIVGNAAAEGGWYALVIYAIFMGLFIRFFDQLVQNTLSSPFVVLAVGSALGQVLGLARGETSLFANIFLLTFASAGICMVAVGKLVQSMGLVGQAVQSR